MRLFVVEQNGRPIAFYNDTIHAGRIPAGAVEIDEQTYFTLLAAAVDEQPLERAAASSSPATPALEDVLEELATHIRAGNSKATLPKTGAYLEARRAPKKG